MDDRKRIYTVFLSDKEAKDFKNACKTEGMTQQGKLRLMILKTIGAVANGNPNG